MRDDKHPSTHWWPWLGLSLGFLALVGQALLWQERQSRSDEPTEAGFVEEARQRRSFELVEARQGADRWRFWRDEIAALEAEDRAGTHRVFRAGESRIVWDEALGQRILDLGEQGLGPIGVLGDLERQLAEIGVDLLVLPIPPAAALDPKAAHASQQPSGRLPRVDRWFLEILAALDARGVETLDLVWATRGQSPANGTDDAGRTGPLRVFRSQDPHWTHWGATLAARAAKERVTLYPWFEEVSWTEGKAELVDRKQWREVLGTTARRLLTNDPSHALEPEEVFEHWTRIAGEKWSFDDRGSPVLLLGDSFALREHGLPDALLRELGFRLDRITVPGGMPTAVLEALALRGDRLAGKRLVIWVFTTVAWHEPERWQPVPVLDPATRTPSVDPAR